MSHYKIIFSGPVGAGKTAAVCAASDIAPICTDESASDGTRSLKPQTTVALDYGAMKLGDGGTIHLYGTPGQERFNFMWEILTEGGIGLILLIDNSRGDPLRELRFYLNAFDGFIRKTAVSIGVTHMDVCTTPRLEAYHLELERAGYGCVPVFEVDARKRRDVCVLVESILSMLDPVARA
jgi:signal recognition particle receptor subunit beta